MLFGSTTHNSLVVLWSPDIAPFCGACFLDRAYNGTDVGAAPLHFQTTILLNGTSDSPSHWSTSVINHEFGHYLMSEFSNAPNEGGEHSFNQNSNPGLAWSEGFASFSGQSTYGAVSAVNAAIYFDVQNRSGFWIDIEKKIYDEGLLPVPDRLGALDQNLNEFYLASMLWELRRIYGDGPLFKGMTTSRLTGPLNRGYPTADLVDNADGLSCDRIISATALADVLRSRLGFPWDARPLCR